METKQPTIWAVLIITFALATICLAFRLFSRYLKKLPFWWDDFFAIACYVRAKLNFYRLEITLLTGNSLLQLVG